MDSMGEGKVLPNQFKWFVMVSVSVLENLKKLNGLVSSLAKSASN